MFKSTEDIYFFWFSKLCVLASKINTQTLSKEKDDTMPQ